MRMKTVVTLLALFIPCFAVTSFAQNYTAQQTSDHGVDIVRLTDAADGVEVSMIPSLGNLAYEMKVHGKNILSVSAADVGELKKGHGSGGNPFLAPWANRLAEPDFWANGKKYVFNPALGNIRRLPIPIHGVLIDSPYWEVTEVKADGQAAWVTSRLQFWKYPEMMAQWPFAHEYEMTYKLSGGVLEVRTVVTNLSVEPMPISIGFHPCFQIPGVPREDLNASLGAHKVVATDEHQAGTGQYTPMDLPNPFPLKGKSLDTGYADIDRDAQGRADFAIESGDKKVEMLFGPKFPTAMVFTGGGPQSVCFEPMAAISNGINLYHDGKYPELQMVAPGAKWVESFWVRSSGI